MKKQQFSTKEYIATLIKLEKGGRDALGMIGHGALTALGAAAAAASAPTLISALGFSPTFLGFTLTTTLATTPVGWVAGAVIAGATIFYGLGEMIHRGGQQDERRKRTIENINKKIDESLEKSKIVDDSEKVKFVADVLHTVEIQGCMPKEEGARLLILLKNSTITPEVALERIRELIIEYKENGKQHIKDNMHTTTREQQLIDRLKKIDKKKAAMIVKMISQQKMTFQQANEHIDQIQKRKL